MIQNMKKQQRQKPLKYKKDCRQQNKLKRPEFCIRRKSQVYACRHGYICFYMFLHTLYIYNLFMKATHSSIQTCKGMCTCRCPHQHTHIHIHPHYIFIGYLMLLTCSCAMVRDEPTCDHQLSGKEMKSWHYGDAISNVEDYQDEPASNQPICLATSTMDGQFTSLQTACQDYFISDGFLFFNQPTDGSGCCTAEASCRNHDMFLPRIFTRDQRWSQKVLSSWNSSMLGRGDQRMVSHCRVHTHRQQASISKYDIAYFVRDMMALVQNSSLPQQHDVLLMWYCWCCYITASPTLRQVAGVEIVPTSALDKEQQDTNFKQFGVLRCPSMSLVYYLQ